jgi:hypothetical protein
MVERNTPSSIVTDAGKFLDWACSRDEFPGPTQREDIVEEESRKKSIESARSFSISEANGYLAGVGTSIADNPKPTHRDRSQQREPSNIGIMGSIADAIQSGFTDYAPDAIQDRFPASLQRSDSVSSSSTETSADSFASAEQFTTTEDGLPPGYSADPNVPTPSSTSTKSLSLYPTGTPHPDQTSEKLQKVEQKRKDLEAKVAEDRQKISQHQRVASQKELDKVTERHTRDLKKQEDKYAKQVRKLEERRERETRKSLAKQQKEEGKNELLKTHKEREEWKAKAKAAEKENALLNEQIGELQRENTMLVAKIGKIEGGVDVLRKIKEDMEGTRRARSSSRVSAGSKGSKRSGTHLQTESHGDVG